MTYLDEVCELARAKGIDPKRIVEDLVTAANATAWGVEDIARSFILAIRWDEQSKQVKELVRK